MTLIVNTDYPLAKWAVLNKSDVFKRSYFACGVYQDRFLVVAGGFDKDFCQLRSAAMYDVLKQSYITLPDLPHRCRSRGLVLNGYFYVAEQYDSKLYRICLSTRVTWEFVIEFKGDKIIDMVTDGKHIFLINSTIQITRFNPITTEIAHFKRNNQAMKRCPFSAAFIDNKIYIIEGQSQYSSTPKTYVFNIVTQLWSEGPHPPTPNSYFATAVINRWIVVTGKNFDGNGYVECNEIYDTHTHKWIESNAAISTPRQAHCCLQIGSHIITVGGVGPNVRDSPITAIYIKHVIPDWIWTTLKPYLLLRKLLDDKRAAPINSTKKLKYTDGDMILNADAVVQKLFTTMSLDMFRYALSFLV